MIPACVRPIDILSAISDDEASGFEMAEGPQERGPLPNRTLVWSGGKSLPRLESKPKWAPTYGASTTTPLPEGSKTRAAAIEVGRILSAFDAASVSFDAFSADPGLTAASDAKAACGAFAEAARACVGARAAETLDRSGPPPTGTFDVFVLLRPETEGADVFFRRSGPSIDGLSARDPDAIVDSWARDATMRRRLGKAAGALAEEILPWLAGVQSFSARVRVPVALSSHEGLEALLRLSGLGLGKAGRKQSRGRKRG